MYRVLRNQLRIPKLSKLTSVGQDLKAYRLRKEFMFVGFRIRHDGVVSWIKFQKSGREKKSLGGQTTLGVKIVDIFGVWN